MTVSVATSTGMSDVVATTRCVVATAAHRAAGHLLGFREKRDEPRRKRQRVGLERGVEPPARDHVGHRRLAQLVVLLSAGDEKREARGGAEQARLGGGRTGGIVDVVQRVGGAAIV